MKLSLPIYLVLLLLLTIAVTLTSTTSSSSGSERPNYSEAQYEHLASGYTYSYLLKTTTDHFIPCNTLLKCAVTALTEETEYFSYDKVKQLCKIYSPKNILTVTTGQNMNEMAYYRRDKWIKVYALSMGANSLVYNSFLNIGNASTWKVEKCVGNFCPNFFRHPILDIWNELPIDEVKLVLSKNQTVVVTMVFNGKKTTITNWFSKENVMNSPWTDFGTFDAFSIIGIKAWRVYISYVNRDCSANRGWLFINEKNFICPWHSSQFYPWIFYSNKSTKVKWSEGYGVADAMAIYIRLKPE